MQHAHTADDTSVLMRPANSTGQAVASNAARYGVWVDDPTSFTTQRVTAIHHNFHEHPLVQLPQLALLATRLMPSGQCRFMTPGATQACALESVLQATSPHGQDIDEVFRRIEEPGTWVALYNVETDPQYRAFLAEVMDTVRPLLEQRQPGIFKVCGYVFISAPPSVTPFHIDRENNFWLQLRGRKTMSVWDHTDRDVVAAKDVEDFVLFNSLELVRLKETVRARSQEFHTAPGDGVYFPSTSPHMTRCDPAWVKPGDGVCVSMGVVFYSRVTRRHARVHQFNHVLRRFGVTPRPPGESAAVDAVKAPLGHLLAVARMRLRRVTSSPPGSY